MKDDTQWCDVPKSQQIAHLAKGLAAPEDAGLFGLSLSEADSDVVIMPVPWEMTTSYRGGTASTPQAIITPSHQLDLFDRKFGNIYKRGICLAGNSPNSSNYSFQDIRDLNNRMVTVVNDIRANETQDLKKDESKVKKLFDLLQQANEASDFVNAMVYSEALRLLKLGKKVGLLGGDHSCPYGLIKAVAESFSDVSILHFDAHFDFRNAYEGFQHSHASIMYNAMTNAPSIKKIVQCGIRDFSEDEYHFQASLASRGEVFYSQDIFQKIHEPNGVKKTYSDICSALSQNVYVSFDIDGLDPALCPGTGTPVPGGLSFEFATGLLDFLKASGNNVVGFDLCEVASQDQSSDWDYNVGARILYKLCGLSS